jgi:nitrogen fixation/metabolism regulation signal transduction histidine kinase
LSRSALDMRMTKDLEITRNLAARLAETESEELVTTLSELRRQAGAMELTVFGDNDRILATTSQSLSVRLPILPADDVALQVRQSGTYIGLEPATEGIYQVRTAVLLPQRQLGEETRILQAFYPVDEKQAALADSVESTYSRYGELFFLREPLQLSFTVTLTLVVLLSFLAAVYGAFFFAKRLVAPIQSLVAGTRSVAEGDLDTRLPTATHDEIGFLVDSFNLMIQRLSEAREEARLSAQEVESERAQLQAILSKLSTGVIAVDSDGRLRRVNEAASEILRVNLGDHLDERLSDIAAGNSLLTQFVFAFDNHLKSEDTEWREQLILKSESGRRILVCACTELPVEGDKNGGNVVVFDDVTTLIQAQRDAAWGEVARRLAHEIKNPLTPIQLSAERIRRRYLHTMEEEDAQVLERATHTIVQQVEAMRDMVNAFSEYARAPAITISRFEINQLVREVAYLYRTRENQTVIDLRLDDRLSEVEADAVRVRQLLHNLIHNAMEAMEGQDDAHVQIVTSLVDDSGREMAEISVVDNGPGIDPNTLEKIFEPYVTTKTKGTGLGLAIVKKLVDEHGGTVSAESLKGGGACFNVRLPVNETKRDGMTESRSKHSDGWRKRV